jgi:exopolysaccharide production protein ExoZ
VQKLRSIQVLRGVAACAVVLHHANANFFGAAGVDLFFVISGFIMATVAADRKPGEFLFDRAWRIYPLWLIALIPWLLLRPHSFSAIMASVTLWPFYGAYPILAVGWSLVFEVVFYVGFASALASRFWVPLAIFFCCLFFCDSTSLAVWQIGSPLTIEFLAGVLIARLRLDRRLGATLLLIAPIWLILARGDYSEIVGGSGAFMRLLCWGTPAAMIVYGARSLERWFEHRAFAIPVLVGDASYAIYLFHRLVVASLGFVPGIGIGIVAHWLIERPLLRLRRKLSPQGITSSIGTATNFLRTRQRALASLFQLR